MAASNKPVAPLDQLQSMFDDILVQTGKALKAAHREGKGSPGQVSSLVSGRISHSIDVFQSALDDLESQIVRAKSTLLRDLHQVQAKNHPVQAQFMPQESASRQEIKPVAPTATMVIDLDPPKAPASMPTLQKQMPARPAAPMAPFPDMGFEMAESPDMHMTTARPPTAPTQKVPTPTPAKITKVPTPTLAKMPTPKLAEIPTPVPVKIPTPKMGNKAAAGKLSAGNMGHPGVVANATSRPTSTPPIQEAKPLPPPIPRSMSGPIPQVAAPVPAPAPVAPETANASSANPAAPESLFTNMGFTVAPPPEVPQDHAAAEQAGSKTQTQPQPNTMVPAQGPHDSNSDAIDLTGDAEMGGLTLESFGLSSVPGAEIANMSGINQAADDNVDAKIDDLFDLGPIGGDNMDLDYDLGGDGGGNSTFDDMLFYSQDDNLDNNEFNASYFGS